MAATAGATPAPAMPRPTMPTFKTCDSVVITLASAHTRCLVLLLSIVAFIGESEYLPGALDVVRPFFERFGIPVASFLREEVATIDMDGPGKGSPWICDGMNDLVAERRAVSCLKFTPARLE